MLKLKKLIAVILAFLTILLVLAACNNDIKADYTVVYDKNSAEAVGTTASSSHSYGTEKALTENGFTREGYIFASWNTKADGSGSFYTDKQEVKNLTTEDGATVTLYAQWVESGWSMAFGTYTTTRIASTTDGSGPDYVPGAQNMTWTVLNKAELDANLLWNGETFSGVFLLNKTVMLVAIAVRLEIYGDGNGLLMIGSGGTNGGRFTYTISGNIMTIAYKNEKEGNTDAATPGTFTITSLNQIYVGSLAGYKINETATKADDIRALTINEDGTGTLTTTDSSEATTETNVTWATVSATTLEIMDGSTLLCTVYIENNGTVTISYYRTAKQTGGLMGGSETWTTISVTAALAT